MIESESSGLPARQGMRRLSVAHFLAALALWLVSVPFVSQMRYGDLIDGTLLTLVLLLAVAAVGGRRRTLIVAAILVTPVLAAVWIDHTRPDAIPREFLLVAGILFIGFVVGHLSAFILRAPRVDSEVLYAAVATFLLLGMLGGFGFELVARLVPNSFTFTVGSEAGRSMDVFEA